MVIRVKARKCEHYKLKYCLTSSLGILSYAEGSKTTDCQDTVLILGKRMRDSLDMGKHHVKNWPPHPKIDPLIPSGQTPKMISTYQYRRKSLWIHWSSSPHKNSIPAPMRAAVKNVRLRIQNRPPFLPKKIEIPQFLLIYDSSLCFFCFLFFKNKLIYILTLTQYSLGSIRYIYNFLPF